MDTTLTPATGSMPSRLIDQDIAHIERVMRPSLRGDLGGPILPTAYWRRRLHALLDTVHLTKPQLRAIDSLLLQLDYIDAGEPLTLLSPLPRGPHRTRQANKQPSPGLMSKAS